MPRKTEDLAQAISTKEPLRRIRPSPSRPIWRLAVVTDQQEIQDAETPNIYPSVVLWDGKYKWDGSVVWGNEPTLVNSCDLLANWTGESLPLDAIDKIEGAASIKDTVAAPVPSQGYFTTYQPPVAEDLSPYHWLTFWLESPLGWQDYRLDIHPYVMIEDGDGREHHWDLIFEPNTWTFFTKLLRLPASKTGPAGDLNLADICYIRFYFGADTVGTPFWKKIDWINVF